jgi:hypothetical protein
MTENGRCQPFNFSGLGGYARLSPVLLGLLGLVFIVIAAPV